MPSSPMIFSAGTSASSKTISQVLDARMPILLCCGLICIPLVPAGTMKAQTPR